MLLFASTPAIPYISIRCSHERRPSSIALPLYSKTRRSGVYVGPDPLLLLWPVRLCEVSLSMSVFGFGLLLESSVDGGRGLARRMAGPSGCCYGV